MAAEDEVVADYRSSLDDLKMNSKPLINMLTMLAEENKQFAAQFVQVIEERVLKASPSEKLPAMYLIDSIIKNLSDSNYLQLFSKNIVATFAAVFEKVDEKTRSALFKLRHTWNDLFAMKVLYALDLGVRDIDPAWPVLPGAKIHVNPKFLPQAQPEEKKTETEAEAEAETGSEHLKQQRILEVNRESCSQLENDILLKQQLMAKQQEILKLHQQRLEIELAKARVQIELQAKLLQKEKDAAKEREREAAKEKEADATKRSQGKESTSPKKPTSTAKAVLKPSTATTDRSSVHSSNRDPRIRQTVDLHTSKTAPASQNKHVAVQSAKSDGGNSLSDFDAVASSGNVLTKTQTNVSGNIFDRMQDLSSSKEHRSPAKNGGTNSEASQPPRLVSSEDSNPPVKGERKKTEKHSSSGKQGCTEDKSLGLKLSPQLKKIGKDGSKKCEGDASDGVQKSSRSTKSVSDGGLGKDSNAQQRRPLKSAHPRSGGTSDHPPVKVKRGDHGPRVSNFKSGPQRSRKNSFREDRAASKAQPLLGERHFDSRKRSRQHESGSAKGFKKPKPAARLEIKDIKHPHQLSDDLKELFGSEDRDYRCQSGALGSLGRESSGFKDIAIALPPPHRRDSLLLSPPIPTSQSSGWAQFKASRPEDFPFQQTHSRDGPDGDVRSSLLMSPGVMAAVARRAPLLPTPHKADAEDSFRPSASSSNAGQVTMDALEKQMTELHRLQDMKRKLDEQREHLIRNSSSGSFGGSPDVSPVDSQSTELHRLQSLKRNLDEQQERLQAMIDSGMKISDEFSSVFPAFGKDLFHQMPCLHNKYLDANDESSRSPIFRENSPRRDRFHAEVKPGLLGDRPPLPDSAFEPGGEEPKALLPTPCLERNVPSKFNHKVRPDVLLPCEDDRFYYPERDARWSMRAQAHGSRVSNVYNVVIDGRHYEMTLVNRPLKIWHYGKEVVVRLDPVARTLWCNDNAVYRLGEDEKSVQLNGKPHRVFVQGPPRKLWIDNQLFDISVDSPPEKINIGGKEHKICIDGGKNRIIVDGFDICPFGTDEHQLVKLAFVMHTIQFQPPCKQILIDGKLCNLDLSGKYPVVVIDGKTRGIRFDGPPQLMFVDDKPWTVAVDGSSRCHLDGPSSKPVVLAFGGPGHEVIVDDQWYELKFGGVEKYIKVGRKMRKFQLMGNPPEVKILGEVAFLTTAGGVSSNGRLPLLPSEGGRPPLVQGFGPGAHHHHHRHHPVAPPDVMHHPDSCENIPSLLNLNFDSPMDRSRSYTQFPHNQEAFNESFGVDQSVHTVGSYGPGRPYDPGQYQDGISRGAQFREAGDPHLHPSQNNDASRRGGHDQPGRFPIAGHRPLLRDRPGPQFGLDVPPSNFGQFPCAEDIVNVQRNVDSAFSTAGADSEEMSVNTSVPQQEVDVNSLLSKLLAAGLIKKASEDNSTDGRSSGQRLQPPESSKKSEVLDIKAPEEEEGRKEEEEEEIMEDVSDLTDFNLENLKKKYPGVIQRVYLGVQCQTCGIRFLSTANDRYNEHLDWHFRRNRREKEEMKVAKFRRWYYDVVDWIQFEELSNADDQLPASNLLESTEPSKAAAVVFESQESNVITCPMASRDDEDICDTCRESFEQFWDEEKEAWHLRDAIQVDGKTYHPICFEDAKAAISAEGVDEETPSVLETTVDSKNSNETDNETTRATELPPCDPKTDDNDQKEISSPFDNLQQNETETEMNANVLIKSELLDEDDKPHDLSSNVFMSNDSPLGGDPKILIKSEDGASHCHPVDDVAAAVAAAEEEGQNESN